MTAEDIIQKIKADYRARQEELDKTRSPEEQENGLSQPEEPEPEMDWLEFLNHELVTAQDDLGQWTNANSDDDCSYFGNAAEEASNLSNGKELLKSATLSFRSDIAISYLGERAGYQGCFFHGFLFALPNLQVLIWLEDDLIHYRVDRRGDQAAFNKLSLQLMMHKGRLFEHLELSNHPSQEMVQ